MSTTVPNPRPTPAGRLSWPGVLLLAAILTSGWAWWLIAYPVFTFSNTARHVGHFSLTYIHMAGGTAMLVMGALNLFVGTTRRYFRFHRVIGYAYLAGGSVAAVLAFVLSIASIHGKTITPFSFDVHNISDTGFALAALSLAWLGAAALAYRAARNRRYESHRQWVIRSYVLVWSFVLCRLVGFLPELASLGGGAAITWLSWVGPLIICEVALQWSAGARLVPRSTVSGASAATP